MSNNNRAMLKNKKDIRVFGKVTTVDWDGKQSKPTYCLKDVQVFDRNKQKITDIDHMWFYCDEPLDKVEQSTIIKFIGDAYHYNKKGGDNYSIKPKTRISIMKVLKDKVAVGKWYKLKANK